MIQEIKSKKETFTRQKGYFYAVKIMNKTVGVFSSRKDAEDFEKVFERRRLKWMKRKI